MRCFVFGAALAVSACLNSVGSLAQVELEGVFVAGYACPMLQSVRERTNPGNITAKPGRAYPMHGINRADGTHYHVGVAGADPNRRWIAIECGQHFVAAQKARQPDSADVSRDGTAPGTTSGTQYVLAASWQPAFCETRPGKPECTSMTEERFDASNFALHGLWPQPRRNVYCKVEGAIAAVDKKRKWDELPEPELSPATRRELERVMPGVQSALDRHEWWKHGTCYGGRTAEEYFADSLLVMAALNASPVRDLFARRIGETVSSDEVRAAFDAGFGPGAGERVRLSCRRDQGRQLIVEITIGLAGDIAPGAEIGELMLNASPTDAGCPGGLVDAAGFQ